LVLAWWRVRTKTSSKLALKGQECDFQRKNVNPMLALCNAVCNSRWKEMWQKAVLQHRKLQALQRSTRIEQRAQALIAVGNSAPAESPPQSAAVPKPLPLPAPTLAARPAESPALTSPSSGPEASQPSSSRPSSRRKKHTARNRVKYAQQKPDEVSGEVCPCGTPLVRQKGHRTKQYCGYPLSPTCTPQATDEFKASICSSRVCGNAPRFLPSFCPSSAERRH